MFNLTYNLNNYFEEKQIVKKIIADVDSKLNITLIKSTLLSRTNNFLFIKKRTRIQGLITDKRRRDAAKCGLLYVNSSSSSQRRGHFLLTKSIVLQEVGFPELTCILEEDLVHVCGGVLKQLVVGVEYDDGNLAVTEHAQLIRLAK